MEVILTAVLCRGTQKHPIKSIILCALRLCVFKVLPVFQGCVSIYFSKNKPGLRLQTVVAEGDGNTILPLIPCIQDRKSVKNLVFSYCFFECGQWFIKRKSLEKRESKLHWFPIKCNILFNVKKKKLQLIVQSVIRNSKYDCPLKVAKSFFVFEWLSCFLGVLFGKVLNFA